ncbi:MAG: zf-HC2 domain-containing protein [Candidatus Krumholzibacteriota bacterium]|nr:zf-HC2 domain-containing protein [Candidatus Krumholzibacteriota bacterium]
MIRLHDCEKYEKALLLYLDGDLNESEIKDLEGHIENCLSCSKALDQYLELEKSLAGLAGGLPEPARLADAVIERLNLKKRRFEISSIFRFRILAPAMAAVLTAAAFIFHGEIGTIQSLFSSKYTSLMEDLLSKGSASAAETLSISLAGYCNTMTDLAESLGSLFLKTGNIDRWTVISISTSMTLLILLWVTHLTRRILED